MTALSRRTVAEALGTAILLATVVGSGIMGERLASGNVAIALLANTLATGAILGVDISNHRSKSVEEFIGHQFDYVITVCDNAKESCPVFPGNAVRIHQSFDDPPPPGVGDDEFRLAVFRRAPDEIRQ